MPNKVAARFYVHEITENNTDYSRVVLKPVVRAGASPVPPKLTPRTSSGRSTRRPANGG